MDEKPVTRSTVESALRALDGQDGGGRASAFRRDTMGEDFAQANPGIVFSLIATAAHFLFFKNYGLDYAAVLCFVCGCLALLGQRGEKLSSPDDTKTTVWTFFRLAWTDGARNRFYYLYFGSLLAMLSVVLVAFAGWVLWKVVLTLSGHY